MDSLFARYASIFSTLEIFVNFHKIMINQGEYGSVTLFSIANVYYINVSYKVFRSLIGVSGVSSCVSIIVQCPSKEKELNKESKKRRKMNKLKRV